MTGAQVAFLPDGQRLHLHHGPIDLIVDVTGAGRAQALQAAARRFETLLDELVLDLEQLRCPVDACNGPLGPVAETMRQAAKAHLPIFVTPMAAVAGAVADEIARVIGDHDCVETAYVNNGGDVALVLAPGTSLRAGLAEGGFAEIGHDSPVRGVATSGWRGRSQSLGIADAVTVLAESAAQADVAATLIANHVDLPGHPAIARMAASALFPDSDLGERAVTVDVGLLDQGEVAKALDRGVAHARRCLDRGLIQAAHLTLNSDTRLVGGVNHLNRKEDLTHA